MLKSVRALTADESSVTAVDPDSAEVGDTRK